MIVAMKVISLGFDIDNAEKDAAENKRAEEGREKEAAEMEKMAEEKNKKSSSNARNRNKKKRSIDESVKEVLEEKSDEVDLSIFPGVLEFSGYCLCPGTVVLEIGRAHV